MNRFPHLTAKTTLAVLLIHGLIGVMGLNARAQTSEDPYRVERFLVEAAPALTLRTSGGAIEVLGGEQGEVVVEMFVSRNGRRLSPEEVDLSNFDIRIEQHSTGIDVEARQLPSRARWGRRGNNESVSFRVTVPPAAQVDGSTAGGSVSASGLRGQVRLQTSGGSVRVSRLDGEVVASTSGGSITASDLHGVALLNTSGGSIRLANNTAKMTARTSGGSVRAEIPMDAQDIELRTSGGSIDIHLPEGGQYDLDLRGTRITTSSLHSFTGEISHEKLQGQLGDGGSLITARASGGRVIIRH